MVTFCTCYFILIFTAFSYVVAVRKCQNCNRFHDAGARLLYNGRRNADANSKGSQALPTTPAASHRRSLCCPYDFDSSICRVLDDRILCGYNKNVGNPISKYIMNPMGDGCRIRGGRLECGYVHGPFNNDRRPPVWDNPPDFVDITHQDIDRNYAINQVGSNNQRKTRDTSQLKRSDSTNMPQRVTRCMETSDNRIVCRAI